MRIDFYYTAKRLNSLVRPDIDETQTVVTTFTDFQLKDQTDMNHPVFIVVASNLPETNYCILSDTGASAERPSKYRYFVDRIEQYRKTVWHIHCTIDALATWRDSILTQSAFVERSTNSYDAYITDNLLPTNNRITQRSVYAKINADLQPSIRGGTYILSLASTGHNVGDGNTTGGCNIYAMTQDHCLATLETMFGGFATQAKQMFNSVAECILGLHWLPVGLYAIGGKQVSSIFIAGQQISVSAVLLNRNLYDTGSILNESASLTHYGDFRDISPYRNYYAKVPYNGLFDLDSDIIGMRNRVNGGSVTFSCRQMLDLYTGALQHTIYCDNFVVGRVEANARVDIPVSAFKANTAGIVGGGIDKVGEGINAIFDFFGVGGKNVDGWTDSAPDKVANWLKSGGTTSIIGGFNGSNLGAYDPEIRIFEKCNDTSVAPSNVSGIMGRPYCGVITLNSLNGYCKTQGFKVKGRMSREEKQIIEDAFNGSGVFITE